MRSSAEAVLMTEGTRARGHVVSVDYERHEVTIRVEAETSPDPEQTLRREGWRPRLVAVEWLLSRAVEDAKAGYPEAQSNAREAVASALVEVRRLIDGDTKPTEGLVHLDADDLAVIEAWWECVGHGDAATQRSDRALLDRLRREVNP